MRLCLLSFFLCLPLSVFGQQVTIAPYYGGRQAAISLTFDDGLLDQYTLAFPQLKSRGLKATFAIIGSKVGGIIRSKQDRIDHTDGTPVMTWNMIREMAADGQEIASHGWEHRAVTRLSPDELHREVFLNDSVLQAEVGIRPLTFVYPGNNKSDSTVVFCEQNRVGSRTFQMSLGSKRTLPFLQNYIDSLITHGEWGVTMTHGISRGYDHFSDPQVLWHFFDYISERQDRLWIAPLCDVSAYIRERDNTTLSICTHDGTTVITLHTSLSPSLFVHPLTLMLPSRPVRQVEQGGKPLPVYMHGGHQLVDVNPHAGPIRITCNQNIQ